MAAALRDLGGGAGPAGRRLAREYGDCAACARAPCPLSGARRASSALAGLRAVCARVQACRGGRDEARGGLGERQEQARAPLAHVHVHVHVHVAERAARGQLRRRRLRLGSRAQSPLDRAGRRVGGSRGGERERGGRGPALRLPAMLRMRRAWRPSAGREERGEGGACVCLGACVLGQQWRERPPQGQEPCVRVHRGAGLGAGRAQGGRGGEGGARLLGVGAGDLGVWTAPVRCLAC